MSQKHVKELNEKIDSLMGFAFANKSIGDVQEEIKGTLVKTADETYYGAFVSVCNTKERATVFHGYATTLEEAVNAAIESARAGVKAKDLSSEWVKLEYIVESELVEPQDAVDEMFKGHHEYFRKGISLDTKYAFAFTEGEINGNRLLNYKDKCFDLRTFNQYTMLRDDDVILSAPKKLVFFNCAQYFCDDKGEVYELYRSGNECGRRVKENITDKDIYKVICSGARYLMKQMHGDGTFDYGYYPIYHKLIPGYNIMRHTSSIWSLICVAELTGDNTIYKHAVSAIHYMLSQIQYYEDGYAYLIEKSANEIKLGANAVAIILLTQYMKLYDSREYVEVCEQLGRGILRMMKGETGTFVHVLDYEKGTVKAEFRTVYYDGEAAFALSRLYSLTKSQLWLMAATRVVDHFIEADYTKYRDHWVAYAVNELTMYKKDEKYFEFGLRNVQVNLDKIHDCVTTYHTYLEMLMASYQMYRRMLDEGIEVSYLKEFDAKKFAETIMYRAEYMLNGYAYPEYVMYWKKPSYFKGAFFCRHDGFRCRIDDVQHFAGAYLSYYRNFDDIAAMLE